MDAGSCDIVTDLFDANNDEDKALLDWLRERPQHPRYTALLQQIMEWTGKNRKTEMRELAKNQQIIISRHARADVVQLRQAVREHFKNAVDQYLLYLVVCLGTPTKIVHCVAGTHI